MSDKLQNPFLTPPQGETAQPQSPASPQPQAQPATIAAPGLPPQNTGQQIGQQTAQPTAEPVMPNVSANPFLQNTPQPQPQAPQTQAPQTNLQGAPTPPVMPSAMPSAQPMAQQAPIRETAATTMTGGKAPNPFDFANQGSASSGSSSGNGQSSPPAGGGRLRYQPLAFTGGVLEYYGVVILNALLTMITLGIYAPWAKVRKQRYFFSHTEFLDEGFQYLATGKQLFIGRIVAIIILVALSVAEFIPGIGIPLSIAIVLFGLPFVLNRSVRFNARNLAWRDVRFGWDGTFPMAILVWMIYPVLSVLTLGLLQPLAARALRRHYADNHSFGGAQFSADLGLAPFYFALLKTICFAVVIIAVFGGLAGAIAYGAAETLFTGISSYDDLILKLAFLSDEQKALLALPFLAIGFAFYLSGKFYFALTRHVMINHLRLSGGIRFQSQLSAFKYALIILTNLLLNILTIGFAHPFTVVRHYRFLTQAIEVRPIADMAGFVDKQAQAGFSVFEEVSDIEGLSIDI